jgi:hypothetical protein
MSQHHFLGYEGYNTDIEVHAFARYEGPVAPSLRCITFLTVLFFSVYLVVIFVRACRKVASCTHDILLPMLMKAADALTLVPMLCILMINSRQRATQLNPALGDPQPWAQTAMYACVASLVFRLVLIIGEEVVSPADTRSGRMTSSPNLDDDKERQCDPIVLSPLNKALLVGHSIAALALYACCTTIVVSVLVMKRPEPMVTPPLTPMMLCSTILTVVYLSQYMVLEVSNLCGSRTAKWSGIEQDTTTMLPSPYGFSNTEVVTNPRRPEEEAYIKIEPVTLQFIPMFCVLLVGIGLRAVQLNLKPDKSACYAMFATTVCIIVQAIAVPLFRNLLPAETVAEVAQASDDPSCFPSSRKPEEEAARRLPMRILTISWSLLMAILYMGIAGTLVTVFAMEAEPLDVVWPEKQIGLLEEFLRHLEKSRHLMENEALHALSTASIPPISTAMRCTMLLTVLYFGVFLGVLVGRAICGPARKQAAVVEEAVEELCMEEQTLMKAMEGLRELQSRDPELVEPMEEQENIRVEQIKEQVQRAKETLQDRRAELSRAQASEAQVCEGVQRSLAFVPMLCVIMIAVRMRAMQLHIRDPQPWAQLTMYVATSAVSTQVVASILWACFLRADDVALSCAEVGLLGKVAAIIILGVRYFAAMALYVAMIALVAALTSMQQGMSLTGY